MFDGLLQENMELSAIAHTFEEAWGRTLAPLQGRVRILTGVDLVVIRIEDAFTPAEQALARQAAGYTLLQRHFDRGVDQIYSTVVYHLEQALRRQVISCATSIAPDEGWMMVFIKLDQPILAPTQRAHTASNLFGVPAAVPTTA